LALAVLVAAACQPEPAGPVGPEAPGERAVFVLATSSGLLALDAEGRDIGPVADLPPQSAPATPALHPSGTAIAFALIGAVHPERGFGSDIHLVDLDGTGLRVLLEHEGDNVFYASPRFDPTGNVLYVHRRAAVVRDGTYVGTEDTIVRVDLRTGDRRTILENAADPAISPDGRTIVYVALRDGQIAGLRRANVDGTEARNFFATTDAFWYIQAPRFSPSGDQVVFSAAGHTTDGTPTVPPTPGTTRIDGAPGPVAKLAHFGIPSDLFIVPVDGGPLRVLTQTGDDVVPAWSPDGSRIAFIATGAFVEVSVADGSARVIAQGENFFFGDLLWLR
ncbi:MAG: TolB family protein, partial [Candidatus Limnocylindria bacterium]